MHLRRGWHNHSLTRRTTSLTFFKRRSKTKCTLIHSPFSSCQSIQSHWKLRARLSLPLPWNPRERKPQTIAAARFGILPSRPVPLKRFETLDSTNYAVHIQVPEPGHSVYIVAERSGAERKTPTLRSSATFFNQIRRQATPSPLPVPRSHVCIRPPFVVPVTPRLLACFCLP